MKSPLRFNRLVACAASGAAVILGVSIAFAASPSQAETGSGPLDNLVFVVVGAVLLALFASVAGGVVITALAVVASRFFRRHLPTDEEMEQVRAEAAKPGAPRRRPQVRPNLEPFLIAGVGLVVFSLFASLFLSAEPAPVAGSEVPTTAEKVTEAETTQALPKSGDFAKIVNDLPKGIPEAGARLFVSEGCSGCHSQKKDERIVGPSFYGLWTRAGTRVPGLTAKEYLYQSIVDPNAHVVEGYQPNIMQQNYASLLSPHEISDLLAWIEEAHAETD
jgi:hypothetical protein